ncbi:MAG: FHA domain-containing protein [Anaerolineae bacterium]|nr:FHA domain-containing protein [Anaerolineae bacterium]
MPLMIMRRGPDPGKIYELSGETIRIGRGSKNDIIIIDNEVSREHCYLTRIGGGYQVTDLESSNGTFVNGHRVKETWSLPAECLIELGDSITLEYKFSENSKRVAQVDEANNAPDTMFLVVLVNSRPTPAIYPLDGYQIYVGRGTDNNIIIVEPEISRQHLRFTRTKDGYTVEDVGSTNGTILNTSELEQAILIGEDDIIRIGKSVVMRLTTKPDLYMAKKNTDLLAQEGDHRKDSTMRKRDAQKSGSQARTTQATTRTVGTGIEPGGLLDSVYLIYARQDWEHVVAPIVDRLYQEKIDVWVEQYLTPGGGDWQAANEQARSECWLLLVVVSQEALESEHILKTWRHFHNREKPVILILHEDVERLPIGANKAHKIVYNALLPESSLKQIIHEIKQRR